MGQLKYLNKLKDLNLDGNPVSRGKCYQRNIILELPHLIYLDNKKISHEKPTPGNANDTKPEESRFILQDLEQWMIKKGYSSEDCNGPVEVISRELQHFHLDLFKRKKCIRTCIDSLHARVHESLQNIDSMLEAKQDDQCGNAMHEEISLGQDLHVMIDNIESEFANHSERIGSALETINRSEWANISPSQKEEIRQKVATTVETTIERFRNEARIEIDAIKEQHLQQHCKRVTQISRRLSLN